MTLCNPISLSKERRVKNILELSDFWQTQPNIKKRFTDKFTGYNENSSLEAMKWFIEQRLELPFDSDTPFNEGHFRRMKTEIKAYNFFMGSKFNNLAFAVPEGISKQDPIARKFYTRLNSILDRERVHVNSIMTHNKKIGRLLIDAYTSEHKIGRVDKFLGKNAITELRGIRDKMVDAGPNDPVFTEYIKSMKDFEKSDNGKIIRQFQELIHMTNGEFQKAKSSTVKEIYNPHVYQAVKESRQMLNQMGVAYVNGLKGFRQLIALKYTNQPNWKKAAKSNNKAFKMLEEINGYINQMENYLNIKPGKPGSKERKIWEAQEGYFPHMTFETIVELKNKIGNAVDSNKGNKDSNFNEIVGMIKSTVNMNQVPDHVKGRNPSLQRFWEVDPTFVLNEYGHQAINFNKTVHTQVNYLNSLRHIPRTDMQFVKGMKRFIDEEYAVFTEGTSKRPAWANKAAMTLNAFQTARTMGLNITGAVKNAASAVNYYTRVGFSAISTTRKAMEHDPAFNKIISGVEREAGFLFTDAAKELYSEGLITRDQFKTGEIEFNPVTGKITMDGNPLRDSLAKASSFTLDKLLYFHRLTENHQRKWMFRTAFHQKYKHLTDNGYDTVRATEFSKNFALKMVNGWAYEYAAHAKAKAVRGEGRTIDEMEDGTITSKLKGAAGAGSEVAFHLLHYPLSLMESQWGTMKGAHKSLLAKQDFGEMEDMHHILRYSGMMGLIGLVSASVNIDFTNIIENETAERLGRVMDDLTQYDNPEKGTFGLMSEFTGPTLGMLKYGAIMGGIIDMEHSDLNKIIFGNVDFADPTDSQAERYSAYQWSTFWGVAKNKSIPALKTGRGRDLITHYLKLYPSKWTKAGHEKIFGVQPSKKKAPKNPTDVQRALQVLDTLDRLR